MAVEIYKLTRRHVDKKNSLPLKYEQILTFSTCLGHGVGTIDFSQKMGEFDENLWKEFVNNCSDYTRFKLGNLSRYNEIEIFIEHAEKILKSEKFDLNSKPECEISKTKKEFFEILKNLKEGYLIIRLNFTPAGRKIK